MDLTSKDIIADLQKSGHKAQRLAPGDAQPFTEPGCGGSSPKWMKAAAPVALSSDLGQASRRRTFYVSLTDLRHPEQPLYNAAQQDNSGRIEPISSIELPRWPDSGIGRDGGLLHFKCHVGEPAVSFNLHGCGLAGF